MDELIENLLSKVRHGYIGDAPARVVEITYVSVHNAISYHIYEYPELWNSLSRIQPRRSLTPSIRRGEKWTN